MNNFKKSFYFDYRLLTIRKLSYFRRLDILIGKYIAIIGLLLFKRSSLSIGKCRIDIKSIGDLGTTISSIVDFYDDIVRPDILQSEKPNVIDVGANIGQFSSAVKLFYPNAKIFAMEPDPDIFKRYIKSTGHYDDIKAYNFGMGSKAKKATFYRNELSGTSSFVNNRPNDLLGEIKISIQTLDSLKINAVDLLKIDVEGYESEVIEGARHTINESRFMLIEISLERATPVSNIKLLNLISINRPAARIKKFGRPLGDPKEPTCQDVLIEL